MLPAGSRPGVEFLTLAISVVYCVSNAQEEVLVADVGRMGRIAFMATESVKETKSLDPRLFRSRSFTKPGGSDLAKSIQRIEELETKNNLLQQALESVATSRNLDPNESASIRDALFNVGE